MGLLPVPVHDCLAVLDGIPRRASDGLFPVRRRVGKRPLVWHRIDPITPPSARISRRAALRSPRGRGRLYPAVQTTVVRECAGRTKELDHGQ